MKGKRGRPKKQTANLQYEVMKTLAELFLGFGRGLKKATTKKRVNHTVKVSGTGKKRGRPRKTVTVNQPTEPIESASPAVPELVGTSH